MPEEIISKTSIIGLGSKILIPGDHKRLYSSKKINYKLNSVYFDIQEKIFSLELINKFFENFWSIASEKLLEDAHIYVLLKVQYEDNNVYTIGRLIRIDRDNYKTFMNKIEDYINEMGDYYKNTPFKKIIFTYGYAKGKITDNLTKSEINLMNFKDMKLPISLNPNDYGKILDQFSLENGKFYLIQDKFGKIINFKEFEKENIIIFLKNQTEILRFKDIKFEENKFVRKIGNKSLFFENGIKSLESTQLLTPFIPKLKKDKYQVDNFITLDIETYGENELIPYLISFYDGNKSYNFYLSDYNSIEDMMKACFDKLFIRKYNNYSIYIHNLAKFDIYFLFKYLIKLVLVDPIIHNGRFIQLNINYGKDLKYKMSIKDSYLILLGSLDKLSKSFDVQTKKFMFPHKFVNENNLSYNGEVPSINNFFKISENEYQDYRNSFDNL